MITVVTTYKLPIFKMFYEHHLHDVFRDNLLLYVDQLDSTEFRALVDPEKTRIFDRNDIIKYYGDMYMPNGKYFKKMYFINMIAEMGLLDDAIYMTDDDVLVYDKSFNDMLQGDKIVYDKEPFPLVDRCYTNWNPIHAWFKKNMGTEKTLHARATNFFIPQANIGEFSGAFRTYFAEFLPLLKSESDTIDKLNAKSRSKRGCDFSVFYLEVPFFDIVFSSMNHDDFKYLPFFCVVYGELRKWSEKLKTTDTSIVMEQFCYKRKPYPNKHPLLHYNVINKEAFMQDSFNHMNGKPIALKNVMDIVAQSPKEMQKIAKAKAAPKKLF